MKIKLQKNERKSSTIPTMSRANDDAPEKRIDRIRSVGGQDGNVSIFFKCSSESILIASAELMIKSRRPTRQNVLGYSNGTIGWCVDDQFLRYHRRRIFLKISPIAQMSSKTKDNVNFFVVEVTVDVWQSYSEEALDRCRINGRAGDVRLEQLFPRNIFIANST